MSSAASADREKPGGDGDGDGVRSRDDVEDEEDDDGGDFLDDMRELEKELEQEAGTERVDEEKEGEEPQQHQQRQEGSSGVGLTMSGDDEGEEVEVNPPAPVATPRQRLVAAQFLDDRIGRSDRLALPSAPNASSAAASATSVATATGTGVGAGVGAGEAESALLGEMDAAILRARRWQDQRKRALQLAEEQAAAEAAEEDAVQLQRAAEAGVEGLDTSVFAALQAKAAAFLGGQRDEGGGGGGGGGEVPETDGDGDGEGGRDSVTDRVNRSYVHGARRDEGDCAGGRAGVGAGTGAGGGSTAVRERATVLASLQALVMGGRRGSHDHGHGHGHGHHSRLTHGRGDAASASKNEGESDGGDSDSDISEDEAEAAERARVEMSNLDLMIQEARMKARDKLLLDASPQGLQGVERRAEGKEAAGGDVGGCTDWSAMQAQLLREMAELDATGHGHGSAGPGAGGEDDSGASTCNTARGASGNELTRYSTAIDRLLQEAK